MTIQEAVRERHSVRKYTDKKIPEKILAELQKEMDICNAESGLHIQMITGEKEAFGSILTHYGRFGGVENYIALTGKAADGSLEEKCGYYGERLVLKAQQLGLNTCWVGASYSKKKCRASISEGEKLVCVIAFGYGKNQGTPHKSKSVEKVIKNKTPGTELPDWFLTGLEAALLAPTAINQQKFVFSLDGNRVKLEDRGGPYSKVDLGIVRYHFEVGAGTESFVWDNSL